jgi:hypothetical protein
MLHSHAIHVIGLIILGWYAIGFVIHTIWCYFDGDPFFEEAFFLEVSAKPLYLLAWMAMHCGNLFQIIFVALFEALTSHNDWDSGS